MKINEVKEARQKEGVDRWFKNKCVGILAWATGVGKTYGAVLAVKRIERQRTPTYLIVLPSQPIVAQWTGMFSTFFNEECISRITFKTVKEMQQTSAVYVTDVLIVDEVHEYTTDDRIKIISGVKVQYKAILALTASITDFAFKRILNLIPIVDEITEKEAKDKGFIAQFHEFNLQLKLTPAEREEYDSVTQVINAQMPKFDNRLDIAQKCINGGYFYANGGKRHYSPIQWATTLAKSKGWSDMLNLNLAVHRDINSLWHPSKVVGYARLLINAIRARKNLLEHSIEKQRIAIEILQRFNQVKTIVFSESTDVVDNIYEVLKDTEKVVKYHSNLQTILAPSRKSGKMIRKGVNLQKTEAIADFKKGLVRIFLSTRAVDRGLDVPDIRLGLTISGSSKTNQYEQRGGRVKRVEEESTSSLFGDNQALLINLYLKDTQDEIWLKSRQKFVEHFIYDVTSIDDISYTPPPNEEFIVDL